MNDSSPRAQASHPWLGWIAILTLVAGLGVGAIALAAPMGVWLGLWDFTRGFQLLFNVAGVAADKIAIAGLIATIGLFALSRQLHSGHPLRLSALALTGTLAAAIAYAVPNAYRPGEDENIPPIHDISTDTVDPPQFVDVLPLRADAPNTTVYGRAQGMTPERLAELTRDAYPDLATVGLDDPPQAAFERAMAAVASLGWALVASAPDEGRIEATDTTFWFRFKDDIVIRIRPADGGSVVDARSVSRVGRGDAGTNAKRLRAFFAAL